MWKQNAQQNQIQIKSLFTVQLLLQAVIGIKI